MCQFRHNFALDIRLKDYNSRVIADAERDWKRKPGAFCRGRGGRGGCAKDGSSWWASPAWVSGVALDLALSVLPRTAKFVVLHVISNEKENLRAEVDSRENCSIVRLFGLFDCHWCHSTFKRRSATPRIQTQQAPAPVATDESTYQSSFHSTAKMQPDAQPTNQRINHQKTAADISLRSTSFASAEEINDGADGWEGIALGRGEADIECGFELVAELDQVECIPSEVIDKGGVEAHL